MANEMSKTMAVLAVSGMVAGLAACGGSTPPAETAETPAAATESKSCSGAKEGHSCTGGKCNGSKEAAPADPNATPAAPADAPK
jgi:hypothetical protein